ncbi:MFS transporter [Modestobacter sp. SYSU DS0290]
MAETVAAGLVQGPVEVLDFLLPLWAGVALGLGPGEIGVLLATETSVAFVARPWAGRLADRYDRARQAAVGAFLVAVSLAGYAVAGNLATALGAAVVGGVGGALFWVALRARVGERLAGDSAAFSRLFAAEGTGTWIAFVVALTAIASIDYRGVFAVGAAACAAAGVVLLVSPAGTASRPGSAGLSRVDRRRMTPLLALVVVTTTAESGVALLLLLHLQRGFDLELGAIASVFLPGFIVYSTIPELLHGVVTRLGRRRVVMAGLVGSAAFAAALSAAPNPVVIAGVWVLAAVGFAAVIPVQQAVVAEVAGGRLGQGLARYESAALLGGTGGFLAAGWLYGSGARWQVACLAAAAVLLLAAGLMPLALRRAGTADRPPPAAAPARPQRPAGARPGRPRAAPRDRRPPTLRGWAVHATVWVVAQVPLAVSGHSWPYEALFGGPWPLDWYWNSSGHWLLNVDRIWTYVLVIDTVWSWGRVLAHRRRSTRS